MKERIRARSWAVQALYAWEARGGGDDALLPILDELQISPRNRFFAEILVRIVARNRPEIDDLIQRHLTNWSLSRLSVIDRNILRIGAAELRYVDDVPAPITIREMIRLAERFGTPESPRFVRGVLEGLTRESEAGDTARRS